jgi:hypothetical protein
VTNEGLKLLLLAEEWAKRLTKYDIGEDHFVVEHYLRCLEAPGPDFAMLVLAWTLTRRLSADEVPFHQFHTGVWSHNESFRAMVVV